MNTCNTGLATENHGLSLLGTVATQESLYVVQVPTFREFAPPPLGLVDLRGYIKTNLSVGIDSENRVGKRVAHAP